MIAATTCPSSDQLRALSLGRLSDGESERLFEHIGGCTQCSESLETVADVHDSLIETIRGPDEQSEYEGERHCRIALAGALGALARGSSAQPVSEIDPLPSQIGEYAIVNRIGRGGMGNVYLAKHTKLGRLVALKALAAHRLEDTHIGQRFDAEMRAVGKLSHPNVVTAHDAREIDGTAVLITEYIDGFDLGQLVSRVGTLPIPEACETIRQIAHALHYTSQQGFVHRDIKPSNIMLSTTGEVKLLDLGLARWRSGAETHTELTGAGQAMGTADYVAPEQVSDSRNVDIRADIYSLGCTLFKLLSGRAPFADQRYTTAFAKMNAHLSEKAPSLQRLCPAVPLQVSQLVDRMLSKQPEERPQTPLEVAEQLVAPAQGADLVTLVRRADSAQQPTARLEVPEEQSRSGLAPPAKPLRRAVLPVVAIGSGLLGLLLGIYLGVIISIRFPDGTTMLVNAPTGTQVAVGASDEGDKTAAENTSNKLERQLAEGTPEQVGATANTGGRLAYSPLSFAVLVEQADEGSKQQLLDSEFAGALITNGGTWYPIAEDVQAPMVVEHFGQRFALTSNQRTQRVTWEELNGHISAQSSGASQNMRIQLRFDDSLAEHMRTVSGANIGEQLAVIFNNRIVAAPTLRSELNKSAEISGNFSPEEVRYLHQVITGGLVGPAPAGPKPRLPADSSPADARRY